MASHHFLWDNPHRNLQNKGIIDSGCYRHMTGNKAYLADFQDFNGGPIAFGGSKGYITGKGKIKTERLGLVLIAKATTDGIELMAKRKKSCSLRLQKVDPIELPYGKDLMPSDLFSKLPLIWPYSRSDGVKSAFSLWERLIREYVAAASCCGQVLWIQNQMLDYGFNFMNTKIYIDNESTICIVKNPVYHSKTKHIAIRHHFIRDAYEKKLIQVLKVHTDDNVADLLTKAFDGDNMNGSSVDERDSTTIMQAEQTVLYLIFKSKKIAQVVRAWIQRKNTLVKHFEDMRFIRANISQAKLHLCLRPSPRPSPTPIVPDSIPEPTGENLGDPSSSDTSLSGNEDDITLQNVYDLCISLCKQVSDQAKEIKLLKAKITKLKKKATPVIKHHRSWIKSVSLKQRLPRKRFSKKQKAHKEHVSKQGRKYAKGESFVQGNPLFDELHEDSVEHMETNDAQDEGRTREMVDEEKEIENDMLSTDDVLNADKEKVSTDKEKVSTDRIKVSTHDSKVSTDRTKVSTYRQKVSSDEQEQGTEGHSQVTQTPAAEIFKDDETI
ncbi:hypothetical protein Tco_1080334, partial [Tanacetum coccineum]